METNISKEPSRSKYKITLERDPPTEDDMYFADVTPVGKDSESKPITSKSSVYNK